MEHTNTLFASDYVEEEDNKNISGTITENELIGLFYNYLWDNQIKEASLLLHNYNCINTLNTRWLNKDLPLKCYKLPKYVIC